MLWKISEEIFQRTGHQMQNSDRIKNVCSRSCHTLPVPCITTDRAMASIVAETLFLLLCHSHGCGILFFALKSFFYHHPSLHLQAPSAREIISNIAKLFGILLNTRILQ